MPTRLRGALLIALACIALSFAPLSAQDATPTASDLVLPPDAVVAGASIGEWSARQWQWFLSSPQKASPLFDDTGARCWYGQSGPVFFLAGSGTGESYERSCTIPAGVAVFVPLGGSECSTIEPEPYFGRDAAELRACAAVDIDGSDYVDEVGLTIDGQSVGDLRPYRVSSPPSTFVLPEGNFFDGPAGVVGSFVADGYAAVLSPLSPGEHEVVFGDSQISVTYRLSIVEPEIVEPVASPAASPVA